MSLEDRRIRHLTKSVTLSYIPSREFGKDGDTVLVKNEKSNTVEQFIKQGGKWISLATGRAGDDSKRRAGKKGSSEASGTTVQNITINQPEGTTSSGNAYTDHSVLTNLDEDDHSQYVHKSIPRTVTASHVFSGNSVFNGSPVFSGSPDFSGTANFSKTSGRPFTVASSTMVTNLTSNNSDKWDGYQFSDYLDQAVKTGSSPAFETINTGQGDNELYAMDQEVKTDSAVTFATVDTGQGANELYAMDQDVLTTSDVTFDDIVTTGDIVVGGDDISSDPFVSGFVGSGWNIDNAGHLSVGDATIRGTLSVYELLIQQIRASNGAIFVTSSAKVKSSSGLSESDDTGTITFEDPSGNSICPFASGDIIMMQRVVPGEVATGDNIIKKLVYEVNVVIGETVAVFNAGYDNTSFPSEGDEFVRIGNSSDTSNRDGILYLTSDDTNSPFIDIKTSINSYSEWNSSIPKVRLGKLDGLSCCGTNEYGLWAGASETNYIKASNTGVFVKGSEDTYLSAAADKLEFFDTAKKMDITGGNITMYGDDGNTPVAVWDDTTITLGASGSAQTILDSDSIDLHTGSKKKVSLVNAGITFTSGDLDSEQNDDVKSVLSSSGLIISKKIDGSFTDIASFSDTALFGDEVMVSSSASLDSFNTESITGMIIKTNDITPSSGHRCGFYVSSMVGLFGSFTQPHVFLGQDDDGVNRLKLYEGQGVVTQAATLDCDDGLEITGTLSGILTSSKYGLECRVDTFDSLSLSRNNEMTKASSGYVYLPGGILLQWGTVSNNSDSAQTFSFTTSFTNNCYSITTNRQVENAMSPVCVSAFDKDGFTVNRENGISGTNSLQYIAIGD